MHARAQWVTAPVPGVDGLFVAQTVPNPVPMRCSFGGRLFLWSTIQFEFTENTRPSGGRKVSTRHYSHSVYLDEDAQVELLSWQWHPLDAGPTYPHLHVHGGDLVGQSLHKLHLPTGRVFLEDVLLFLLNDDIVDPAHPDAHGTLEENLDRLHRYGTWGTTLSE